MQAVLISINPKWCELITSGKKTVEVRKTKPKLETPFKCYIYCTDQKGRAFFTKGENGNYNPPRLGNRKVIGEFVCDCITPLYNVCYDEWERLLGGLHRIEKALVGQACLTEKELHDYANGKRCYAWHITDLVIYDKPRELSEFWKSDKCPWASTDGCTYEYHCFRAGQTKRCGDVLSRPPQGWCYVERSNENADEFMG